MRETRTTIVGRVCVRRDVCRGKGYAFRLAPFASVSLWKGHLYIRRWGRSPLSFSLSLSLSLSLSVARRTGVVQEGARWNEGRKEGRKERKKRRKEKKEEITTKGKPVRRSHYRLDFDCSGSAGTGATRYTLYSASVRFLEIHSEKESTRTQTRNSIRNSIRLYECTHSTGLLVPSVERKEEEEEKEPPRYVGRSLIMSDRESVILKTIMVSTGVIYISLFPSLRPALPTFAFLASSSSFVTCGSAGRPPTRRVPSKQRTGRC